MKSPQVSVCIPTYNYGNYLPEAIESVLKQTYTDFELLVVDDASQDDTDRIVRDYMAKDSRIRYLRNAANIGMVNNWNRCMSEARGEYIKYLFGDDVLSSPVALERMAIALDADSSVTLVGSARKIIDEESNLKEFWSFFDHDTVMEGGDVISICLSQQQNFIGEPSAVMFRKCKAGRGFDGKYRQLVDLEMWFHLLEQGRYVYLSEPLCAFRVHAAQQTKKNEESAAALDDTMYLLQEYLDKPYVRIGRFTRGYLAYDHAYQIWKSYWKWRRLGIEEALQMISSFYGTTPFFLLLPLYKVYKPCMKLCRFLFRSVSGSADWW